MSDYPNWLEQIPRALLGHLPTPLEPLDRLSEELGGPRIWLKRDDCTGLATGGNKTRKLEYLMAEALAANASHVITFGAVQSNHARQTAAACARLGLPCVLVLSRQVPWPHAGYESSGNILLDRLAGADVHVVEADEVRAAARAIIDDIRAGGGAPYVIPAGGSNATGALGYVRCAYELQAQCASLGIHPQRVVHASSSAGTQAGLVYGFARAGADMRSHGINVYHAEPGRLEDGVRHIVGDLAERFGAAQEPAYAFEHRFVGDGYGIPSPAALDAIRMAAGLEGVLFDPVYSGKALGALIDLISIGDCEGMDDIVMLHTGGAAALAVYDTAFG